MKKNTVQWRTVILYGILILFLPVAFFGIVALPNEYRAWGGHGVDCDGPFLLAAAIPAAGVYGVGAVLLLRQAWARSSTIAGVLAAMCVLLVGLLCANIFGAYQELNDPNHKLVCDD